MRIEGWFGDDSSALYLLCKLFLLLLYKFYLRLSGKAEFGYPSFRALSFPGDSAVKNLPVKAGDTGLIPGSGRSPGEENGNPLQYSCLENPRDRGDWWAAVHGVAKSRTQLNNWACMHILEHSNKYYNINSQRVVPNQQLECHHHLGIQLLLLLFSRSVMSDSLDPMDYSMPGFPVLHCLPEFVQTHVHWVSCKLLDSIPRLTESQTLEVDQVAYVLISFQVVENHSSFRIRTYQNKAFDMQPWRG